MGPGRFGLPTSRLSGVRSNQLSYEPKPHPRKLEIRISKFEAAALPDCSTSPNLNSVSDFGFSCFGFLRRSWFERRFITMDLKKSNKKTAAFTASGLETFTQVFPAVKA